MCTFKRKQRIRNWVKCISVCGKIPFICLFCPCRCCCCTVSYHFSLFRFLQAINETYKMRKSIRIWANIIPTELYSNAIIFPCEEKTDWADKWKSIDWINGPVLSCLEYLGKSSSFETIHWDYSVTWMIENWLTIVLSQSIFFRTGLLTVPIFYILSLKK